MHTENDISIFDFAQAISEAVDLVSPVLNNHHKRVAHISCSIAQVMGLTSKELQDITLASILHDIGAFTIEERLKTLSFDFENDEVNKHAMIGYKLLNSFAPLKEAAYIIKHHHAVFDQSKNGVPVGSYVIHLADRVSILFDEGLDVLEQIPAVLSNISEYREAFHPDVFNAFEHLTGVEYLWIEAFSNSHKTSMLKKMRFYAQPSDLETLHAFAKVIAQMIDFRSRFTATHSSGVAAVALELSDISGFSESECKLMEIAGLLHDLGKLAISNDILEKPSALNRDEFNIIKKHTYYTYDILSRVPGMENLAKWAAYHHERQDGGGYPFHVKGRNFSKLSRIMAVADIVTALTEDRPYRPGMNESKVKEVLISMVQNGGIDKNIVGLVNDNYLHINNIRCQAQREALKEYKAFQ